MRATFALSGEEPREASGCAEDQNEGYDPCGVGPGRSGVCRAVDQALSLPLGWLVLGGHESTIADGSSAK